MKSEILAKVETIITNMHRHTDADLNADALYNWIPLCCLSLPSPQGSSCACVCVCLHQWPLSSVNNDRSSCSRKAAIWRTDTDIM